jgi:para-aminobenzoate synthetase component I
MWSTQPSPAHQKEIIERLCRVLPSPFAHSSSGSANLRGTPAPLQVAEVLRAKPGFVWLDGGDAEHRLFAEPIAELTVRNGQATVTGPGGRCTFPARGFDLLKAALECWSGPSGAMLAGFIGYELGAELESVPMPPCGDDEVPDLYLSLFDFGIGFGPAGWRMWSTDAWRGMGGFAGCPERAEALLQEALGSSTQTEYGAALSTGPLKSRPGRAAFQAAVSRTLARIHDGELFQANLCRRLEAPLDEALAWPLFLRMRSASPARHGAFVALGGRQAVASVSPELFLRVRDGRVESRPIKGTRPRGDAPEEDRRLALDLLESEKDRAELAMIVDVVRNDLGRVCTPKSVSVIRHAELISLPTVHHTVSTVAGVLRAGVGAADLLRATFPPASITGAPKIRAMEVAMEEEGQRRGPCMGSIGWISPDGQLELSVAIRTAVVSRGRVSYHAGGGITAGSHPESELDETCHKARAFVRSLGLDPTESW